MMITVYVVSFDERNFRGQGLPNIFAVKISDQVERTAGKALKIKGA